MTENDFDGVANIYDRAARFVFGSSISEAQSTFLPTISPHSRVLIVGGGTGRVLAELLRLRPAVEVVYVEKSKNMLEAAKNRVGEGDASKVRWVNDPLENWETSAEFDAILCHFFLDVFEHGKLEQLIVPKLVKLLKPEGKLLVSDFQQSNTISQKILLWAMHRFFRLTCCLESRTLGDLHGALKMAGFTAIKEAYFFKQLIFSRVYTTKG